MRTCVISILTLVLVAAWTARGFTGERELHGMLIGAGSGAIIGSAIGGSTEAAIIGSAIGGAVGVAVSHRHGNPLPHHGYIIPPPFTPHPRIHHRPYNRHIKHKPRCRVVEKYKYKHGRRYSVTKRICRDDRNYHQGRGHYRDRGYYGGRHDRWYRHDRYNYLWN